MKIQTAAMAGVSWLYNYQRFNPDWLRRAVLDQEIYLANPQDFNDPWDCRPCYNDDISDPEYRDRLIERIDTSARRWTRPFNQRDHNARLNKLRSNPSALQDHVNQFSLGVEEAWRGGSNFPQISCLLFIKQTGLGSNVVALRGQAPRYLSGIWPRSQCV